MFNIATINIQNKYKLKKYDGILKGENHIEMLFFLIKQYNLDVIGLQEVNQRYFEKLKEYLPKHFSFYGKFRYPKSFFTKYIYPFSVFNESVPILTNKRVLRKKTKLLPWISSYVPRIVTFMEINTEEFGPISILNTHLDYMKVETKKRQLEKLYMIIERIKKPVILMGDFNMTVRNKDFQLFIKKMEGLNIKRVEINEATFKNSKSDIAIDHIFLSNSFVIEEVILEKSIKYSNFSDHYPIIVRLSSNFEKDENRETSNLSV